MVVVLVVPDGAAEPVRAGLPTSLETARTPTLDRLAAGATLRRVRTIPPGLPAGTEVGLPALLGARLSVPPSRGLVEAAAAGIVVPAGQAAWRLDLRPGRTPGDAQVAALEAAVAPLGAFVHRLRAHRLLLVGPVSWGDGPPGPHQTARCLADVAVGPFAAVVEATGGVAWPWGTIGDAPPPLARTIFAARPSGAALGLARLLGCTVVNQSPAQVIGAAAAGSVVLVHDPAPDDAAHARDRPAKIAAIERFDAALAPVVAALERRGGRLLVCPDHGCDPATGRHDATPVPALTWPGRGSRTRLTERAVASLAVTGPELRRPWRSLRDHRRGPAGAAVLETVP